MPYVKILERKRVKKSHAPAFSLQARIVLLILVSSFFAGWMALLIGEALNSRSSLLPLDMEQAVKKNKEKIVKNYKDKFGDSWKEKLRADYKQYTGK